MNTHMLTMNEVLIVNIGKALANLNESLSVFVL